MPIKISADFPQPVEAISPAKKRTFDNSGGGKNSVGRDQVDLENAWDAENSPTIQNMQLYVVSAHKIASLAEDFQRLLQEEEIHQESQSTLEQATSSTKSEVAVFNDYSATDLEAQTNNRDSLDSALNSFIEKVQSDRRAEGKQELIYAVKERAQNNRAEEEKRAMQKSEERNDLNERLMNLSNPPKDVVLAAREKDIADRAFIPKPKPDEMDHYVEAITFNPPEDKATEFLEAKNKERVINSGQSDQSNQPKENSK